MPKEENVEEKHSYLFSKICAIVVIVIASIVLLGWIFGVDFLLYLHPAWPTMKANTSICFILTGIIILIISSFYISKRTRIFIFILSWILIFIVSLTIVEYFFNVNLFIDEIIIKDYLSVALPKGRMSLLSATCFFIIGTSTLAISLKKIKNGIDQYIYLFPFFIGLFALFAYVFGAQRILLKEYSSISFFTALLFIVSSLGLIFKDHQNGWVKIALSKGISGMFLRNVLIINLLDFPLVAALRYWGQEEGLFDFAYGLTIMVTTEILIVTIVVIIQSKKTYNLEMQVVDMNQLLLNSNKELSRINADLDNFVYTASHDLKAPINNIEGLISNLYDELNEETKNKKELTDIKSMIEMCIMRFNNTLGDLASTARMKGGSETGLSVLSFEEITNEIKLNLKNQIEQTQAEVKENFSIVPYIRFSKKELRSILYNLISNAIKYRSPERRPEIRLSTYVENGYIVLAVSDNGLGIKEEDKEKVFQMFQRIHSHIEGTGVGLGIVSRIVDNSGGKIEIESEFNKGSVFKVYLNK